MGGEGDKLLGFCEASFVVDTYVCGSGGAKAHDGSGKFATSAALCLTAQIATNVQAI